MGPVLRVSGKCEVFCRAEPDAGTAANAGGGGAAHAASEARAQLELRNAGAGSAGQGGVSQFLPDRDGEGAGREDAGSLATSDRCGHGARVARSDRGAGAAMAERVRRVVRQTQARVFEGVT